MGATGKNESKLVFIVDDEAMLAQLAETVLQEAGFRTRTFLDPEEVLRAVRDDGDRPDLLVTDFVMGSMTGLELIDECRKAHKKIRTILLSGTVNESQLNGYSTKPDCFMAKPYRVKELVALAGQMLGATA